MAQIGMPFDNVDDDYIRYPKKWDEKDIQRFMFFFGSISTILDLLCFAVLWFIMGYQTPDKATLFQTGWFAFGIVSQTIIIHTIRTDKLPFIRSRSSVQLLISTTLVVTTALAMAFTDVAYIFDLAKMPVEYLKWIGILVIIYIVFIEIFKRVYVKIKGEWL